MKLITNEGKEIAMDDLQSIIIEGKQKVIIYMPTTSLCELSVSNIFRTFDDFFGDGRWMLTSEKLHLEVQDTELNINSIVDKDYDLSHN